VLHDQHRMKVCILPCLHVASSRLSTMAGALLLALALLVTTHRCPPDTLGCEHPHVLHVERPHVPAGGMHTTGPSHVHTTSVALT
jgi:hypothetical protein